MKHYLFLILTVAILTMPAFGASSKAESAEIEAAENPRFNANPDTSSFNDREATEIVKYKATIFSDDFANLSNWDTNTINDYELSDSPGENYLNSQNECIYTADPVDMTGASAPEMVFDLHGNRNGTWDYMDIGLCDSGDDPTVYGNWTWVAQYNSVQNLDDEVYVFGGAGSRYIGFRFYASAVVNQVGYELDDVRVRDGSELLFGDSFDYADLTGFGLWEHVDWGSTDQIGPQDSGSDVDAWLLTSWSNHAHSAVPAATDTPLGLFPNEGDCSNGDSLDMWLNSAIDCSSYENLELTFWEMGDTGGSFDQFEIDVSTNGGTSWTNLETYSLDLDVYTLHTTDLSAYDEESDVRLRFKIDTTGVVPNDGWFIDDLEVTGDVIVSIKSASLGEIKAIYK